MASSRSQNSWEGVAKLATEAGAKWPSLVAAQWSLESAWGQAAPNHNYFGLKALPGKGEVFDTMEEVGGKKVPAREEFLKFPSLKASLEYLVTRWYKDFEQYKGVNNAGSVEEAAQMLQTQGYATDGKYAELLIDRLRGHAAPEKAVPVVVKPAKAAKPVLFIQAQRDTLLKKKPNQASELNEKDYILVPKGKSYPILQLKEMAQDAHVWVELGFDAGKWFLWMPHWVYTPVSGNELAVPVSGNELVIPAKPNWADFNSLVTPSLTVGEVLQWDTRRRPQAGSASERRILKTALEFQNIRNAYKQALGVTSFYRPEPINREVGGVPNSHHVWGEAMDIYPVSGNLSGFYQWIRQRWTGGLGDGRPQGFVHLDTQSGGRFVPGAGVRPIREWNY